MLIAIAQDIPCGILTKAMDRPKKALEQHGRCGVTSPDISSSGQAKNTTGEKQSNEASGLCESKTPSTASASQKACLASWKAKHIKDLMAQETPTKSSKTGAEKHLEAAGSEVRAEQDPIAEPEQTEYSRAKKRSLEEDEKLENGTVKQPTREVPSQSRPDVPAGYVRYMLEEWELPRGFQKDMVAEGYKKCYKYGDDHLRYTKRREDHAWKLYEPEHTSAKSKTAADRQDARHLAQAKRWAEAFNLERRAKGEQELKFNSKDDLLAAARQNGATNRCEWDPNYPRTLAQRDPGWAFRKYCEKKGWVLM